MKVFEKKIIKSISWFNWISVVSLVVMMLLTTFDVILRFFGYPIPGTYEIVGLLGSVIISFSLAYTSIEKGHIAVEFLTQKFSEKTQELINAVNSFILTILFVIVAVECVKYGNDLLIAGHVSPTVQIPVYPFIYGVAAGFALQCPVSLIDFMVSLRRMKDK